jgi:pimeloyl-ACP methyl ester carboxylesterase
VVVLAHGLTASKDDPSVVVTADAISAAGHDVFAYDARGHHGSGGLCTLGDRERYDVAAAVALARERSDRVVVVGASMGAMAALRYAVDDPELTGVVSVSSPALWRPPRSARTILWTAATRTAVGRHAFARWKGVRIAPEWSNPEPPRALVARITVPLAVVHGLDDRSVPAGEAELLAAAARGPCRLTVVPGMGHAFDPASTPAVLAAIRWILDGSAP